jgi:PASTA domain
MTDTLSPPTIPPPPAAKPRWKQKKFFVPVGVVGALLAIAAVNPSPDEQPSAATPTTEAAIAAPIATEAPVEVEAPVVESPTATVAPDPVAEPATTAAPAEAPVATVAPDPVQEPAATTPPAEAATAEVALMPNVVGMNLQDAQDLIQEHGVFLSLSEDASGRDRSQLIDSNWVVVGQNIEPGQPFGEGEAVLSVVKYSD